jgi:hypothetical protein
MVKHSSSSSGSNNIISADSTAVLQSVVEDSRDNAMTETMCAPRISISM